MLPDLNNKDLKDWGWKGYGGWGKRTLRSRTSKRPDDTVLRVEEHLEDMARAPLDSWGSDRASSQAHFSNIQNTLEAEGAHPQSSETN